MEEKMPYRLSDVYQELMEQRTVRGEGRKRGGKDTDTLIYFFAPVRYCNHDYEMCPEVENVKVGLTHCPMEKTEETIQNALRRRYSPTYNKDFRGNDLQDDVYDVVSLGANYSNKIDDIIRHLCASYLGTETVRETGKAQSSLGTGDEYIEKVNHQGLDKFIESLNLTVKHMKGLTQHYHPDYTRELEREFLPGSIEESMLHNFFYNIYARYTDEARTEMTMIKTPTEVIEDYILPAIRLSSVRDYNQMDLNSNGLVEICDFACKDSNILLSVFNKLCKKFEGRGIDRQTIADGLWGICLTNDKQFRIKAELEDETKCKFTHIICVPGFLNWIRDNKNTVQIPEKLRDMKFDYIIMNPPYNDVNGTMLHYKFLCKALEVAETVVSIQPATWMNQQKNRAGLPLNGRGAEITMLNDMEHLFQGGARMKTSVSVSVFSRKYNGILVDWGTGYRTKYDSIEAVNMTDRYSMLGDILEKGKALSDSGEVLLNHTYGSALGSVGGDTGKIKIGQNNLSSIAGKWIVQMAPIIHSMGGHLNKWGLFTYGKADPVWQHDGSPKFPACCCVFDTEQEARNCYAYLASDLVRAYVIAYKKGSHVLQARPHIPWPADFDTDPALWTNEAISDRAGLDQKEREWLAEMLPDCYHVR